MADIALKIRKLLELASKGNTTEAEASVALNMAQELLAKYNLSMAQIEEARDTSKPETAEEAKRTKEQNTSRSAMYEWQRNLWRTLATVNYCWYYTVKGTREVGNFRPKTKLHMIVGREANVLSTRLMGEYLEETINRLCPYKGRERLSRSALSWREGCASRLQSRLVDKQDAMIQASQDAVRDVTALTLRSVQDQEWDANYMFMFGKEAHEQLLIRRLNRAKETIIDSKPMQPVTAAEQRKRDAKQARAQAKYDREQQKYWDRRDMNAWYEGRQSGDAIGLDAQAPAAEPVKELE